MMTVRMRKRLKTGHIMFALLAACMLTSCRDSPEPMLPLIAGQHADDRIEWRDSVSNQDSSVAQLFVHCSEGIGQLELERPATGWPVELTIGLQLAALEGFSLSANGLHFQLEVTSDLQVLLEPATNSPLTLVATPQDDHSEKIFVVAVSLDPRFADAPKLSLRWIDFYR